MNAQGTDIYANATLTRHTLITDLPADILLIIAREVLRSAHRPAIEPGSSDCDHVVRLDPWGSVFARRDSVNWSAVIPYQELLASLFPLWRIAMSPISSLWTHLVIWTGRNPTPFERIHEYLLWSRDKPLDIFILRRYDPSLEDPTEKAYVNAVLELLLPHMQRWRVLCMKLLHSSSLPIPNIDLVGPAEKLTRLYLDFLVDDLTTWQSSVPPTGRLEAPLLTVLSMGGVHFRDAYVMPRWEPLFLSSLTELTVADYQSCNGPFPFIDLLTCLTGIAKGGLVLKLENLQLDCSYTGPQLPYRHPVTRTTWESWVHFIGMDVEALVHYPRLLDWVYSDITYVRCATPLSPGARLATAAGVHFSDIHDPAVLLSLLKAVSDPDSDSYSLSFTRCSCLREIFRELGKPPAVTPDTTDVHARSWMFSGLGALMVEDCSQISSADFRALIEARAMADEAADIKHAAGLDLLPEDDVTSLLTLTVRNCGQLAPYDRVWFLAHLDGFWWEN
ncbi:hypothetical protein FOMPIDRAFT_1017189 [Fomitopsis schrenkii]|uniref:F-box domain-containing protein n=1 Tax=Fomitopsis schrenkii TaxID=2126942 RepID=S8FLW8_FOMSC|nr:hypothetical protein FOMPIDRAFT_1017189 [Fomitopsis schrenkii]